jgi:hypothetical protein
MRFEILGEISNVETFTTGSGIRELARLRRLYGRGRWRKRKGIATIRLHDGTVHQAELHWYEASSFGRKDIVDCAAVNSFFGPQPRKKSLLI